MKNIPVILLLLFTSACAAPTAKPPALDYIIIVPTLPHSALANTTNAASGEKSISLAKVNFLSTFSDQRADWQVVSGALTAAQMNAEVARREGAQFKRAQQKVFNGFLRTTIKQQDGQVFEVLFPAEIVDGKLEKIKIKNVKQIPVLSSHALLLEDYFSTRFPDEVKRWVANGASAADMKYAAIVTVTWATKYGPLRISYKLSGKYIIEASQYPGQLNFLRLCMFEQTELHYQANNRLALNSYPVPIVGLSGTTLAGVKGMMQSDSFGWTPMLDFAKAESATLNEIGNAVSGIEIESKETLAQFQVAFDKTFMPVYCAEDEIQ